MNENVSFFLLQSFSFSTFFTHKRYIVLSKQISNVMNLPQRKNNRLALIFCSSTLLFYIKH